MLIQFTCSTYFLFFRVFFRAPKKQQLDLHKYDKNNKILIYEREWLRHDDDLQYSRFFLILELLVCLSIIFIRKNRLFILNFRFLKTTIVLKISISFSS